MLVLTVEWLQQTARVTTTTTTRLVVLAHGKQIKAENSRLQRLKFCGSLLFKCLKGRVP